MLWQPRMAESASLEANILGRVPRGLDFDPWGAASLPTPPPTLNPTGAQRLTTSSGCRLLNVRPLRRDRHPTSVHDDCRAAHLRETDCVLGREDSNSGIRERAVYLRYCDNSHWLRQNVPAETVRV